MDAWEAICLCQSDEARVRRYLQRTLCAAANNSATLKALRPG
ncbi:hypothetical protein XHC_1595 [Xanthomonas hortorum pv. carotae str. M081]|nr:hypothetical protein XHC_1595 [Xanthomonas hortorum pv. carotae str. M081]